MNERLQKELSNLESLIATQKDTVVEGGHGVQYMHGMANGMILAHAIFANQRPEFITRPRKPYGRLIRHKCVKSKRNKR